MSKKDYEAIAAAIRSQVEFYYDNCDGREVAMVCLHRTASSIAIALSNDNPRFNRDRFLAACGVED